MNEDFRGIKCNIPIYFDIDWIDNGILEKIINGFNERKNMTLDELLETVPPQVKEAIMEICERAGTYDADWEVLKAAGELLVKYKVNNVLLNNLITAIRRFIDDTDLPVTELVDAQIAEIEDLIHAF